MVELVVVELELELVAVDESKRDCYRTTRQRNLLLLRLDKGFAPNFVLDVVDSKMSLYCVFVCVCVCVCVIRESLVAMNICFVPFKQDVRANHTSK